ncbi:MAG: DegT/DnrJ/EryC1/StrS family aminotransferase [Firmicutes bacterium]|nr:DegT/DnrJ/EryC1/StrS family aminotransferase [Bacillota bacterium]
MSTRKSSDFRYDTGDARVPWAAVGESYTQDDVLDLIKFMIQKGDDTYDTILQRITADLKELAAHGYPPGKLTLGSKVAELERLIDSFLETENSTFIANATAGFEIGYRYANLEKGDEVIVPAITFIATISYPLAIGAKVVFADVDPRTINMDPRDVERKITKRTKVIVPVHIGGWPVDMDPIMDLAKEHDLLVIEDAAHAFGAVYKGKKVGTIGHFGAFSFHEVKNITSFGEGGIVTCNLPFKEDLKKSRFLGLDLSRKIKNWLYDVVALQGKYGYFVANNCSSTEIQALGLIRQMARLDQIIETRRRNAEYLSNRLKENDAIIPQLLDTDDIQATYHLYLLQIDPEKAGGDIQDLKQKLQARGIVNIPHFAPLYKFDVVKKLGYDVESIEKSCPVAEEVFNRRFTHLPIYGLSQEQLDYMADGILDAVDEMQKGK